MPPEFAAFHRSVSALAFEETPDYASLSAPFIALLSRVPKEECIFDWSV